MQKHCTCQSRLPDCCQDGWRITLAGSRFLQDAEARYAPIEGEALAVAWGLEQSKYFTVGCDDLLVVTDHKPLVKILGDRMLDEIHNTRMFRLKQRTLPWRFSIAHLPGKSNVAADATSRHPSPSESPDLLTTNDVMECAIMASIRHTMPANLSISWGMIGEHTHNDPTMCALLDCIQQGFHERHRLDPQLKPYWRYRNGFYELDGVILYQDRVVVPPVLRRQVIDTFHAAHQGVSSMGARAQSIVFWPGITSRGPVPPIGIVSPVHLPNHDCLPQHSTHRPHPLRLL